MPRRAQSGWPHDACLAPIGYTLPVPPPAVTKAFAAKYGSAKATRAVVETAVDGKVTYELAFAVGGTKKEATFASDGTFLEKE